MVANLKEEQKHLIQKTWLMIRPALMDHGVHIFVEFFERFPDNQKYFPKFQGVPISKINVRIVLSHQKVNKLNRKTHL